MLPKAILFAKSDISQVKDACFSVSLSDDADEPSIAPECSPAAVSRRVRGFVRSVDHGTETVITVNL